MTTTLQTINASASPEVQMNENAASLSPAAAFGKKPQTTAGLTFGYYGGTLWVDGVLTEVADGTVVLTNATTNYIERTRAGVVSSNTVGFTAGQISLFTAATSGGVITTLTDQRITNTPFIGLLSKSVAGNSNVTLTAAEARNSILTFSGALTGNISVIVPTVVGLFVVNNQTTGAFTLTVKTAAGTGSLVPQSSQCLLYCDGTSVLAATGLLTSSSTAGIGYATGAGGAVAQATSRTTGVTLSKLTGTITTDTTSLAALAAATFTVINTLVAIGDVVLVSQRSGATNVKTDVRVTAVAAGSFNITVHNIDAATAEVGAIIINFAVIKAVSA
ncbi:MAG: hypothetical protein V1879_03890 [Pseudomonadota bacterium]